MNVGKTIKKFREAAGMTQKQLGALVCIDQSMIAKIERGTKAVTVPLLIDIADALNRNIIEMFQ